jgi:hypothetical protein
MGLVGNSFILPERFACPSTAKSHAQLQCGSLVEGRISDGYGGKSFT